MYQTRLGEPNGGAKLQFGYTEMDPSGRYGCFREILGKGAMKTVYKAFDEVLGIEVAWNQVKFADVFRTPEELHRLHSEVHLLKNLDHESIIRYHTSWVDVHCENFNFITEMFTSGTLREYRQKYKRVSIRAMRNWARQILEGVVYLHSHDPPVIHRDLKCDNIFINGHLGQVKIGDLGLAAILRGSNHAHSVIGTPEFMAPELYEEEYDELVDIYSFGMCMLEMLTSEYPYSECSNPAQIYKKVTSGKLPKAFYQIQDVEAQRFVGKCLEPASKRPSAQELLMDPFLAIDEDEILPIIPKINQSHSATPNETTANLPALLLDSTRSTDMMITGTMDPVDDTIFLKVKISGKDGQARNVYFPFDIVSDTAMDVAMEMVKELEITDWEPHEIAEMIDDEISALVPTWKDCVDPPPQHSFNYEFNDDDDDDDDDDENIIHHPFYSLSSNSSSQASLLGFYTSSDTNDHPSNVMTSGHDWLEEDLIFNDDTSSQSSLNSFKYSNLKYCSGNESEFDDSISHKRGETIQLGSKTHKCTRFCPEESTCKNCYNKSNSFLDAHQNHKAYDSNHHRKMSRMSSFVDIRSQLLQRSLEKEINKRRLFKTVGAMENIGFHEPGEIRDEEPIMCGGFSRSSHRSGDQKHKFKL